MKELKMVISEFFDIFSGSLCIVCIALSGFLIFINLYHYQEIGYEISNNYLVSEEFNNNKVKILNLNNKIDSVKENKVKQSDYFIYSQTKAKLEICLDGLEKSKFYTMDNNTITGKNIYDYNNELVSTLQYKCLFDVDYTITSSIKEYKSNIKYDLTNEVIKTRNNLMVYGDYLRNRLFANGNYHYSTENTKISIYNDYLNYFNLTINNYNNLLEETEKLTNWFVNEFGR